MKNSVMEPLRYLDWHKMEQIHGAALHILDKIGMRVHSGRALEYLRNAGCRVDMDTHHVRFPNAVVESAVARMRSNFVDPGQSPGSVALRYSRVKYCGEKFQVHPDFTVSAGGFCCFVYDLDGVRRPANMTDVRESLKLADRLDQISYTGLPCTAQEVPARLRPIVMAAELAKTTRKLGGIETFSAKDVDYICRIGEVVAGGPDKHRKRPVLVGYAEARSPLSIDEVMAEVMLAHLERGLPQSLDTMPNGGATAPVTAAGILAQGMAETLGGLVLGFAVDSQARMTLDVTPGYCDMRSMMFGYAGAERIPLLAARVQLISEYYGCPSGIHGGKTNSCVPGIQAGVEKATSMMGAVTAGAIGFGTIGHLENALTFSPAQLVIDNEIARYVRRCVKGIDVNDDTLALDVIEAASISGSIVDSEHTASHFRDEQLLSPFFDSPSWGAGNSLDQDRFGKLAREKVLKLLSEDSEPVLSPDQEAEIDEIVEEAARVLSCEGGYDRMSVRRAEDRSDALSSV